MAEERILVVADDYYASLAAVRALRQGGYAPWVASTSDGSLAARSSAATGATRIAPPSENTEQFVADVVRVVEQSGARVVLPGTEASLLALAGQVLADGVVVGAPARATVELATAKEALAGAAERAGVGAPDGTRFSAPATEPPAVAFPAVVKPARSTIDGADRTHDLPRAARVDTQAQLEAVVHGLPAGEYLAQPFVDGPLGAVAGVAWRGELACICQQVAARIEPPFSGASAYAQTVAVEPALRRAAEQFVGEVGWSGLWELQFIAGPEGPVLIDFNPRFYGSLALAVTAGLNLPSIWVDLLLGRTPRVGTYRPGVRYRAEIRDAKLLYAALRSGRLRDAAAIARPHRGTAHAVFSWRDPLPAIAVLARRLNRHA